MLRSVRRTFTTFYCHFHSPFYIKNVFRANLIRFVRRSQQREMNKEDGWQWKRKYCNGKKEKYWMWNLWSFYKDNQSHKDVADTEKTKKKLKICVCNWMRVVNVREEAMWNFQSHRHLRHSHLVKKRHQWHILIYRSSSLSSL